jgi:hypothetical protein
MLCVVNAPATVSACCCADVADCVAADSAACTTAFVSLPILAWLLLIILITELNDTGDDDELLLSLAVFTSPALG